MTERDGKSDQDGEVERWDAAQAARAMGVCDRNSEPAVWKQGDAATPIPSFHTSRRGAAIAAVLVIGAMIAIALRAAMLPGVGQQTAQAFVGDSGKPRPNDSVAEVPAMPTRGQEPARVRWSSAQGGNDHWYQVIPLGENLDGRGGPICGVIGVDGALTAAIAAGAHLVTLHSQAEHDFVHGLVARNYPNCYRSFRVLTGGIRSGDGYAWRNGEPFDFSLMSEVHPVHPAGSPIVMGMGPENGWCPLSATGCWMTFPEQETWAFHVAVLEWAPPSEPRDSRE